MEPLILQRTCPEGREERGGRGKGGGEALQHLSSYTERNASSEGRSEGGVCGAQEGGSVEAPPPECQINEAATPRRRLGDMTSHDRDA